MSTVSNVSAGKPKIGGAISVAPLGTTAPNDATTALNNAFKNLGYASEDGLRNNNSPSSENVKAWGGDNVLNIQNEKTDEFTFTLLEVLDVNVMRVVYGDSNVTVDTQDSKKITVKATNQELTSHAWAFDMIMRDGALKRIYLPNAKVSAVGEIAYTDSDAVGYAITLTAFPDSDGVTHHEFIKLPATSA